MVRTDSNRRTPTRRLGALVGAAALLALPAFGGPNAAAAPAPVATARATTATATTATATTATATTATATVATGAPATAPPSGPAVRERRLIGRSTGGRPIFAYRLGEPNRTRVVLVAAMHGDEARPRQILWSLRDGGPVHGLNLWVIPTYNPDGVARGTRKNGRGVDLNRNFPYRWAPLSGETYSGPRPGSEPETRAVMRFLDRVHPRRIVSFHQPLNGVDTDTKRPRFSRRLARSLHLPRKSFNCSGVCHGTMTGWFNANHRGAAVTVEYGPSPRPVRLRRYAPSQILRVFGAHRG